MAQTSNRKTKGSYTVSTFKVGMGNSYVCVKSETEAIILRNKYRADGYESHYHINN